MRLNFPILKSTLGTIEAQEGSSEYPKMLEKIEEKNTSLPFKWLACNTNDFGKRYRS